MKKTILSLIAILTIALSTTKAETGANLHFSYTVNGNTVTFTDLSIVEPITNGDSWDIYWQTDTGNYPNNKVNMVAYHTQQKSDSVFSQTYTQSGTYHVTLIYQKWHTGSNGGRITKSVDIIIVVDTTVTGISEAPIEMKQGKAQIFAYNKQLTVTDTETEIKQVQVFNVTGQLVVDFNTNSNTGTFSLSELTNGIYIVSVTDANNVATNKKIVIQ